MLEAFKKKAAAIPEPAGEVSRYFGELVFSREKMRRYLDPKTCEALVQCIDEGSSLDMDTADKVAAGMKKWALVEEIVLV